MENEVQTHRIEMDMPTQSGEISELAAALAIAQGQIEGAKKDSNNPFFSSKYADLKSVWDAIRKPFADNGLSIIQRTYGLSGVETLLFHSSGQWILGGKLEIAPAVKYKEIKEGGEKVMIQLPPDAHGIGSAITYARRYSLMAVAGVAPEDDDGNAAVGKSDVTKKVDVKPPAGTNDKELGKLKRPVLESVETLPQEKRAEWRKRITACKTAGEVKKVNDELAMAIFEEE